MTMENKHQLNEQELNNVAGSGSVVDTIKDGVNVVKTGVDVVKDAIGALGGDSKKSETKTETNATPAAGPTNNITNSGNNNKNAVINGNNAGGVQM